MGFLTAEFFSALFAIIMIDLVLAGDNAIVIGMAARRLPQDQQKKAIFFGTIGAVVVRIIGTLLIVTLLKIPGLLLIGGLLLIWIAYKLLVEQNDDEGDVKETTNTWAAIRTIIIADAAMGLDNVLAVGGAAHGNYVLVVLGLLISIPLVVWGSMIILKFMERFPAIIYIGAGVLAWTAARMITEEEFLDPYFDAYPFFHGVFITAVVLGVVLAGVLRNQRTNQNQTA